jgi:hypothetical protein
MLLILRLLKLPHQIVEEHSSFTLIILHSKDQLDYLEAIDQIDSEDLLNRYLTLLLIDKIEDSLLIPYFLVLVYAHLCESLISACKILMVTNQTLFEV